MCVESNVAKKKRRELWNKVIRANCISNWRVELNKVQISYFIKYNEMLNVDVKRDRPTGGMIFWDYKTSRLANFYRFW